MTTFFGPCCGGLTSREQLARAELWRVVITGRSAKRSTHHRPNGQPQEKLANAASPGSIDGLDRLTSVNEQGMNDPQVDQDEGDRQKRLNRDKQEIGEGLDAHKNDAEPAGPGRPRDDSKASRQDNKTHNQVPPAPRGRARTDPVVGWLDVESAPDYQS